MKKYHLMIATGLLVVLIYPSVTFASWWNPFSWFKKKPVEHAVTIIAPTPVENKKEDKLIKKPSSPTVKVQENNPDQTAYFKSKLNDPDPYVREAAQGWLDKNTAGLVQNMKNCKPENAITEKVPVLSGDIRGYFSRVINSNPPLNNLEGIRIVLIKYREGAITSSGSASYEDTDGNKIPIMV